jgi:uncharacterized protein YjiS (DUF1127 family)
MRNLLQFSLRYPRLEAAIEASVDATRALWRWLSARHLALLLREQHRAFVLRRARRELQALNDRTLQDIGLRRSDIDSLYR